MKNRKINALVTAGDTSESIDDVRRITHMATGQMGCLVADEFSKQEMSVTLLRGEYSQKPIFPVHEEIIIRGVTDLKDNMERLLLKKEFSCVVHTMAVSDYTVDGVLTKDDLIEKIMDNIPENIDELQPKQLRAILEKSLNLSEKSIEGKISSELENLLVFLKKAPKVISCVKKLSPKTILVGFKLLSNVQESELINAAKAQMKASGSDLVLANDLSSITKTTHSGMLLDHEKIISRADTKQGIAKMIVAEVKNRLKGGM